MTVATSDDVATSIGRPLAPSEEQQVVQWLGDAELQIRVRLGDLTVLDQEALAYVEREAVVARLQNPGGYQYEAIDDYRYGLPPESRKVTILDEWWRLLDPQTGSGAFSARPYFVADVDPAPSLDWS